MAVWRFCCVPDRFALWSGFRGLLADAIEHFLDHVAVFANTVGGDARHEEQHPQDDAEHANQQRLNMADELAAIAGGDDHQAYE